MKTHATVPHTREKSSAAPEAHAGESLEAFLVLLGRDQPAIARMLSALRAELPPCVTRAQIVERLSGALSVKTLANLDSLGQGPARGSLGGKTIYFRDDLLLWLARRMADQRWGPQAAALQNRDAGWRALASRRRG